jgi:hypothetical protein
VAEAECRKKTDGYLLSSDKACIPRKAATHPSESQDKYEIASNTRSIRTQLTHECDEMKAEEWQKLGRVGREGKG